jgi:large subunit ribosomal protein L18
MNTFKSGHRRNQERRGRRVRRVRGKVAGTPERPRLVVYRSHRHLHAQAIDDATGRTLAAASTESKEFRAKFKHGGNIPAALAIAELFAQKAKAAGIQALVLDKRWYRYHGRVKAFADAVRKAGLVF